MSKGPWTVGQVAAVAAILAALAFILALSFLADGGAMCPPFCGQ